MQSRTAGLKLFWIVYSIAGGGKGERKEEGCSRSRVESGRSTRKVELFRSCYRTATWHAEGVDANQVHSNTEEAGLMITHTPIVRKVPPTM